MDSSFVRIIRNEDPDACIVTVDDNGKTREVLISDLVNTDIREGNFRTVYDFLQWRFDADGIDSVIDMMGYSCFAEMIEDIAWTTVDWTEDSIIEGYGGVKVSDWLEGMQDERN